MFYRFMLKVADWLIFPFLRICNHLDIKGLENIPDQGPVVLASNHLSLWDPVYLFCCIRNRKLNFMAKAELFKIPVIGWVISHVNAFPVHRNQLDRNALRKAAQVLSQNEALVLFPEGTRSRTGELLPFYDGAVLFAQRSQALIVPIAILNSAKSFPKGFRQTIRIQIGKPLSFAEYNGQKATTEILSTMTRQLREEILQMQESLSA
jgi:1-acyl-sn-glycerol-3-phosphate acyltransferase